MELLLECHIFIQTVSFIVFLKPSNICFDTDNITLQSISGSKCTPICTAPEVMQNIMYMLFK